MKHLRENANKGVAPSIRGLDIASRFFWLVGMPVVESEFPAHIDRMAAGLVAAGSDCAGNDDQVSRDSDWGPRFQLYLTERDFDQVGTKLQALLDTLPAEFEGMCCNATVSHPNRAFSVDGFFLEHTCDGSTPGFSRAPTQSADWLRIPESRLFEITRGQIFYDPIGEFTERRKEFAAYYPEDVWRVRLAAALRDCGEAGQILLPRSIARDDYYTAEIAWWRFVEAAMQVGFCLNRRYAPETKWLYREFCKLPELSVEITNLLWDGQADVVRRPILVDRIAGIYREKMAALSLVSDPSDSDNPSLISCAEEISATSR